MNDKRCFGDGDPLYESYHDLEWGRPVTTTQGLYERLCLEAFQAGLSWSTVLHKREALREAFCNFNPESVAAYTQSDISRLMGNAAIIRNRQKIEAAVNNARILLELEDTDDSLTRLIWRFSQPRARSPRNVSDMPASTPDSELLAKTLRKQGFRFVGPTTAYATMQAAGLVNDHLANCPVRGAVERERKAAIKALLQE